MMSCGEQDGQGRGWPTIQGKQGECGKGRGSVRAFFLLYGRDHSVEHCNKLIRLYPEWSLQEAFWRLH